MNTTTPKSIQDFENGFQFQVMLSYYLKGKPPANWSKWGRFHNSFKPTQTTPRELAVYIWKGYSFAPLYKGRRREEFFKEAGHIAFDFDAGDETSSLPFLMREGSFAWTFSSFAYSTPSSTPDVPKSRVVFVLEKPIRDAPTYRNVYQALSWWMAEHDEATSDPQCKDPLRLYFGSPDCEVITNWSILGQRAIDEVVKTHQRKHPPHPRGNDRVVDAAPVGSDIAKGKKEMWLAQVEQAPEGERHNTLLKTARLLGGFIASGYYTATDIENDLLRAALVNTDENENSLRRTIRDGIAHGRAAPLQFEMPAQRLGDVL